MAEHPLTNYLLKLHTTETESRTFSESKEAAKHSMSEAGVSEKHQAILLKKNNSQELSAALTEELGAPNFGGGRNNVVCPIRLNLPNAPDN